MPYQFNSEDAIRFARFKGIRTRAHGNELTFQKCPFCGGGGHDKDTFSINLDTGQYKCLRESCGAKGNMLTLAAVFNFDLGFRIDEYYRPQKSYRTFNRRPKDIEAPKPRILQYLEGRGISKETAERYHLTIHSKNESILVFPFFDEAGRLQFVKYRNMDFKKGESKIPKEWCQPECKPILFGMYQCNPEVKRLIITEGQLDSLSVAESGIENAVSVPTGAKGFTWVPYCWDFLEHFEHIIIFGDHEKNKITLVEELKPLFRDKILVVRVEDYKDCKDANELLQKHGKEAVRNAVENAQPLPILRVVELADVEIVDINDIPKLKTGISNVDRLLHGGVPFGGVTIISGKPGEGKSTLASQLLIQALQEDKKCFAYSGELPNGFFKSWINYQIAGPSHIQTTSNKWGDEIYVVSKTIHNCISEWYRGKLKIYENSMLLGDENDGEEESLIKTCESVIRRSGVEVLLIDNLMTAIELEEKHGSDKYERQANFVKKLARLAQAYNVLILLVAHKRKNNFSMNGNDEISGASEIANLAMLTMAYEKNNEIEPEQRLLKIMKNRLSGKVNTEGWTVDYEPKSKRIYQYGYDSPNYDLSWLDGFNPEPARQPEVQSTDFIPIGEAVETDIPFD